MLNLKRLWGDKYLVRYEPGTDGKGPEFYQIPCAFGYIAPWGENELIAVYVGYGRHTKRLLREFVVLKETKETKQVVFPPGAMDEIAALLIAKQREYLVRRG